MPLTGGCRCGALRYQALNAPRHSMICHCASCRKSAAAPLVPWVTFPAADVTFSGTLRIHASSPGVERGFCPECGTPISYAHAERANEIDITTCSLDQPEAFPPKNDSWLEDDLDWMHAEPTAARPRYSRFRPD